jgi:endonuclease/exonuclease/phosphatase family metal-dependent hydrolase
MRIVSWNLNRASWSQRRRCLTAEEQQRRAWTELAALGADVALIQEAVPPPGNLERPPVATLPAGAVAEDWRSRPGPRRWWCSAIASWGPVLERLPEPPDLSEPLTESHKGAYRIGRVPWGDGHLVLVSAYALWDYSWLEAGQKPIYSETTMHRILSDITPIIDVEHSNLSVLVAGDFNASTQFPPPYRAQYRLVLSRLECLGLQNISVSAAGEELVDCPCADVPCRHVRTLEGKKPYQDDYVYASRDVAAATRLVAVERTPGMEAVSDHLPVVVEIE